VLANLLPGLREIRAPLISGYLWLVFFFLVLHEQLPTQETASSTLEPLFDLAHDLSALGVVTVSGVAAYLVGSAVQELLKLLCTVLPGKPFYGEAGTHLSTAGRADLERAVEIRIQSIRRRLFQVALSPGEKGVDEEPSSRSVERELPLIRTLLLGEHADLIGELDRLQAEADLRITVAIPVIFFALLFAIEISPWWLFALTAAGLLLAQGYQRQIEAGDLLAKALRIGKVSAPSLESLDASSLAAVERIELEEELARKVSDGRSPMAAFRLGNLQATGENYEGAIQSLRFAADNGVIQAYAEIGLVCERIGELSDAEQAYRDGEKRKDRRATERLAALLRELRRDEEALATEDRAEEGETADLAPKPAPVQSGEPARIAEYERRIEDGDAKAAVNLGLLRQRREEWSEAIGAFEVATTLDDEDARAWVLLAQALGELRREKASADAFERAVAILELNLGSEHLEVAEALAGLGGAKAQLGEFKAAQRLLERSLAIQEKEMGSESPGVAYTLGSLAIALSSQGDLHGAWDAEQRTLQIKEKAFGSDHPTVAITLHNMGITALDLGDLMRAKEGFDRALRIQEKHPGTGSLDLAYTLDSLGSFFDVTGAYHRALELHGRALELKRGILSEEDLPVLTSQLLLARSLHGLGRYARALELLQRALPPFEAVHGSHRSEMAESLLVYARTLNAAGRGSDAVYAARRGLELVDAEPGLHPGLRAATLVGLGAALNSQGSLETARPVLEEALQRQEEIFGPQHLYVVEACLTLGSTVDGQDCISEAERLFRRAVEILTTAPVMHRPWLGIARRGLAHSLLRLEEVAEAEAYARQSVVVLEEAFGKVHPELAASLDVLATVLEFKGDDGPAAIARSRAAAIREKPDDEHGQEEKGPTLDE
jgi:tetratricopeptide (TPR) repeat protein